MLIYTESLVEKSANRNIAFDLMKGFGIVLMIWCHLSHADGLEYKFIYSFHMPLFFFAGWILCEDGIPPPSKAIRTPGKT